MGGTYKQIQEWVFEKYGFKIETCWIAHVKELSGLPIRPNPKRKSKEKREKPCPDNKREAIVAALRHYKMIPKIE